jgi:hypothetical protein
VKTGVAPLPCPLLTHQLDCVMSVITSKADFHQREDHVCFVPQADICDAANNPSALAVLTLMTGSTHWFAVF